MKRALITGFTSIMIGTSAYADMKNDIFIDKADAVQVLGSEFIGARVYVAEKEFDENYIYETGVEKEWDDVGEINDIVLTREGEIKAAIIGVGGFLGLGEKDVAVNMEKINFVSDGADPDEYFVVFTSSRAALESAPDWDETERRERMAEARKERMAERKAISEDPYAPNMMAVNAVEREGYKMVKATEMKASDLIGARVYGTKDEDVGEISDLVIGKDSNTKEALIDIGGFLGMGEKTVSLSMDEMRIMRRGDDGDDLRVYVDASQERLKNLPEYEQ